MKGMDLKSMTLHYQQVQRLMQLLLIYSVLQICSPPENESFQLFPRPARRVLTLLCILWTFMFELQVFSSLLERLNFYKFSNLVFVLVSYFLE